MPDFELNIEGLDQVMKMLDQLPDDVNDKVLQDLAMKGAQIAKKDLAEAAPEGNNNKHSKGKLSSKVAVAKSDTGGALVGFKKSAFYVRFIEKGTKVRQTKSGANRGAMPRKPFIEKSFIDSTPKVVEYLSTNALKIINNSIKKQLKKIKVG